MRLPVLFTLITLAFGLMVDRYIIRRYFRRPTLLKSIYIIASILLSIVMLVVVIMPKKSVSGTFLITLMWVIFTYFSVYLPKDLMALFALVQQGLGALLHRPLRGIAIAGLVASATLFGMLWWGALVTRNSIKVNTVNIEIPDLPRQFDGYRIVQLSDIHTGSLCRSSKFLDKMVERVEELHPDIIFFTGDIVNRHSAELRPFTTALSALHAPDGVWSVMGNHDYGEYYRWNSDTERLADIDSLKQMQQQMGWRMLNNDNATIKRGNDSIVVIGVENIGEPPFSSYGNLHQAYSTVNDSTTKILLTHNPRHWTDSISNQPNQNIALTLSGHTHAMQFKLLGWSPASWRYHTWGGLYADSLDRKLYVNTGLGEVAFPARIGATPEITLFILSRHAATR